MPGTLRGDLELMRALHLADRPTTGPHRASDLPRIVWGKADGRRKDIVLALGAETGERTRMNLNPVVAAGLATGILYSGREGGWISKDHDLVAGPAGLEPWRVSQYRRLFDEFEAGGEGLGDPGEGVSIDAVRFIPMGDGVGIEFHQVGSALVLLANPVCAMRIRDAVLAAGRDAGLLDAAGEPLEAEE